MKIAPAPSFGILKALESRPATPEPPAPQADPQRDWDRHLASASDAVYASDLRRTEAWLVANGATQVSLFDRCFTQAVGYVREGHRCLVVRGTQQKADWVMDGLCFYWGSPAVHFGFHRGWRLIANEVRRWMETAKAQNASLYVAGHSLGAAVAVAAAADLSRTGVPIEGVVLFGCPRVGTPEFAVRYQALGLGARTRRYVHLQDGVCVIPPPLAYAHVAPAIKLGRSDEPIPPAWQFPAAKTNWNFVFFTIVSAIPGLAPIGWNLARLANEDPTNKWFNPEQTSLGRSNKVAGYAIFFLVLAAAKVLLSIGESATWLTAHARVSSPLYWITAAAEAFLFQQTAFALLIRVPFAARLLLSIAVVAALFWFFPIVRIDTIVIPILVIIAGFLLLVAYAAGGGVPDHFMNYYLHALGAAPGRRAAEK